jgi:diaminopimelate epimerase
MIPFIKAHACGNDFLIISQDAVGGYDKAQLTQRLCDRYTGIGADGIEFFAWTGDISAKIQLYNADGSIAEISGNGTRCVAAWMAEDKNARPGDEFSIETDAGVRICKLNDFRDTQNGPLAMVVSDMDIPEFEEQTVTLADGTEIDGVYVNMGNPHYVIVLDDAGADGPDFSINDRTWQDVGEEICYHADFPDQTNVEFVSALRSGSGLRDRVAMRIYERGVGPTESSGTGTSATAVAMIGVYGGVSPMEVETPGGIQSVEWAGDGQRLYLTGPAMLIARGEAW